MPTKKKAAVKTQEAKAVREFTVHLANLNEFLQNSRRALPEDMQEIADSMARYIAIEAGNLCYDLSRLLK